MAEEKLLLLKNISQEGYAGDLAAYRKAGGYAAWKKVMGGMKP